MKTRILSGLLMLPLLAVVYIGDVVLLAACFIVAVAGVREFYNGFLKTGIKPCFWIGYLSAAALYSIGFFGSDSDYYLIWFFGVIICGLLYLFRIEERELADSFSTITGAFYVVFFSYHVVLIDQSDVGILVWLVLLTAFGTDITAYFTGYFFRQA